MRDGEYCLHHSIKVDHIYYITIYLIPKVWLNRHASDYRVGAVVGFGVTVGETTIW